ncbi:sugar phosphate isomerase/epimerase family protein [Pseudolysinimonas yzui]|uniref:Inosose dehydratase n=1 Tax=Pseudolysinimonas yzui TaxID=2708254 RepID=A0A8J3M1Z2_9MICO|nr:sugar phosphate isomerase/epimerase [Pseudolysinimonas yzui]GHF15890.1 inosose dehydratase [Pseudolysinimonas yzui]
MIRWGYAINQFNPQFDDFVRRRQHQRALRVISISGFSGVELSSGSGRWEPLGNPTQIAANFGSVAGFGEFVREAGLDAVSSWFWDPWTRFGEDLTHGDDPTDPAKRDGLIAHAEWFAAALAELGGSVLVVRPAPYAGQVPRLDDAAIATLAASWEAVGTAIAAHGIRLGLHFDFLSSLRADDGLERLLAATDPTLVGLALDTAEFAIAGRDAVAAVRAHADRIVHVHLKNAAAIDTDEEYLTSAAEYTVLRAGGARVVPRWFNELATEPLLVDAPGVVAELVRAGYEGWVVVESDFSPHPATSVMLNGWEVQHVLAPIS